MAHKDDYFVAYKCDSCGPKVWHAKSSVLWRDAPRCPVHPWKTVNGQLVRTQASLRRERKARLKL
jgi:hypothetical protein